MGQKDEDVRIRDDDNMLCYLCALDKKDTEAVAICIVCGMGVCMDHLVREEVEVWEGGYPFPAKKLKRKLPRILCKPCYSVYHDK